MKNIYLILIAIFVAFSCEQEEFEGSGLESLRDFELSPVSGARIELNSVAPDEEVVISWNEARSGFNSTVNYTWLVDEVGGDFSSPLLSLPSDNDGIATKISLTNEEFDQALAALGLNIGEEIEVQWTVSATNGDLTKVAEPNIITLKRYVDGIAPFSLIAPGDESTLELDIDNPQTEILIDWDSTFSGLGNEVNYKWVVDESNGDFSEPLIELESNGAGVDHKLILTHETLDVLLAGLGLADGESVVVDWRVVAYSGDLILPSNVFTVTLRRFNPFVGIETLFFVGDATISGWDNNNNNQALFRDPNNNFKFYYRGYFNAGAYKFLENKGQWAPQYGDGGSGTLVLRPTEADPDPAAFSISTAGYYDIIFDGENLAYSVATYDTAGLPVYASVAIIGDATPNGWADGAGQDTDMTQSSFDPHIWYLKSQYLTSGEMKFRTDDSWSVNWGSDTFPVGQGTNGGPNIVVEEGTYTIWFNDLDGRYALIKE